MASEDAGYDYDDGVAYDYDDNDVYGYDDNDVFGYDDGYVYEGNGDGDYGLDIIGNDENLSEDIASNQGNHGDYRDPNHDDDDDDDDHDHDVVVDSESDDSGVIVLDSGYGLGDISQQMEKMYFEHNGALNENPGGAGVGPVLKSESLGSITNNTIEYKAVNQGAATDLHMGYGSIRVYWDSQLLTPHGADHGDYYDHDPDYDYELCDDTYITQEMTDSSSDLEDITQQMEKVHLECDGASNGNFGRASKGAALKYEMGIMSEKVYLEFDGASKGNPGRAGAGALLKSEDGAVITRVREGLGEGTNNDAEYRSLIQGLKTALDMGYDRIHAKGDSQLLVKQVKGEWQTRNDKMAEYRDEARKLSYQFKEFEISHIPRVYNSDADAEAQKAVNLPAGQVQKEGGNWHYIRK